jgi:hypothetical protein
LENTLNGIINYRNPAARVHDVDCLSAISRLRKNSSSIQVENPRAVFVTANASLAKASHLYFSKYLKKPEFPHCIADYALGNLMWLKNPTQSPNLPYKRLLADFYAALQPSDDLWQSYLIEIDKLQKDKEIGEEDYYLLRYSLTSRRALMDITKGEISAFSEGTISQVLEIAKENIRADLQKQLVEERARAGDELAAERAKAAQQLEEERSKAAEQIKERERAEISAEAQRRESEERQRNILNVAQAIAKWVSGAIFYLMAIAIAVGMYMTFPGTHPSTESWVTFIILFILAIAGLFHLIIGTTIIDISKIIERRLSTILVNWLKKKDILK